MLASSMMFSFKVSKILAEDVSSLTRSITVNLKGIYLTISWVVDDAILGDSITDATCKVMHMIRKVSLVANLSHNLGRRVEVSGKHHVGWNKKLVGCAVRWSARI